MQETNTIRQILQIVWNEDGDWAADYNVADAASRLEEVHGGKIFGTMAVEVHLPRPVIVTVHHDRTFRS